MTKKPPLSLRDGQHRVDVVVVDPSGRPELGRRYPEDADEEARRIAVLRQWGAYEGAPRQQPLDTIDEALPVRTQTILSRRLPAELREKIDAGVGGADEAGRSYPLDPHET